MYKVDYEKTAAQIDPEFITHRDGVGLCREYGPFLLKKGAENGL